MAARASLRIGIDYLPAVAHAPGVGRYARELVRALVQQDGGGLELALFEVGRAPRVIEEQRLGLFGARPVVKRARQRVPRRMLPWLARTTGLGADRWLGGVDLFHHVVLDPPPVTRARQMIALSELPPPESQAERDLRRMLERMEDVLVFSSEYMHRLTARFGLPQARVHRVAVGCDHWRRELAEIPAREDPPQLLVLGASRAARRHVTLVRAFEILQERGLEARLMMIGSRGPAALELESAVARSPFRERITCHATRSEADMPLLVARASALVHLSDDEGTPVTPLEGFAVGAAVVASRLPAFEEALGELAEFVDNAEIVRSPDRLAEALARAIESGANDAERSARMQHARAFTWERNARETVEVWRKVIARPR